MVAFYKPNMEITTNKTRQPDTQRREKITRQRREHAYEYKVKRSENIIDKELKKTVGEKDFKIIKSILKPTEQTTIIKYRHSIRLANAMDHCFWIGNKHHKTIYANTVYQKTTGYPLKECLGQPSDFCFDEESKRTIAKHHKLRAIGIASKYEATYITKQGKKIPVLIIGAPTSTGGTYGMHINLTEVKKHREQQRISEQIVRNSTEAIVILDKTHHIKIWNTGAMKIFGYKEKEVLGKKLSSLIVPKKLVEENKKVISEVEKKKFIHNFETKRHHKNGEKIDVSLSITKVTDSKNNPKGYLIIYNDITDRKKVNTELQKRFEAIQDAYKELGIQKRQADYMNEIADIATSEEKIDKVAKLIVSAVCMLTKCDSAILRLLEPKGKTLKLLSCLGVDHKWLDKSKIALENSLAEDAFKTGRPIIIQDIDTSTKHQGIKLVKSHKFKTLILIPLIVSKKFIGTLSIYATDPGKFRLIETEFLERFGKQCSLALYTKKK